MSDFKGVINNLVQGDDCDIIRQIGDLPVGQFITDGWLTVREDSWSPDTIISKHITTTADSSGQITDAGTDLVGVVRFRLSQDDTVELHPFFVYAYDIQIKITDGTIYTPEIGTLVAAASVTSAT